jgi:hypothetical protein
MDRMMDSRRDISKTNKLITNDWKNAFTVTKTVSISQAVFNGFRLVLNENDLIRRQGFRDPNFKRYLYIESIASTSVKSQKYYAG